MANKNIFFQWRKVTFLFATFFSLMLVFPSCKKKDNKIGQHGFNEEDLLNSSVTDTFYIETYNVRQDSVNTKGAQYKLIGGYNDPKVGKVDASFYTQLGLENTGYTNFGTAPVIDSLVLALQLDGAYGAPEDCTFEVFELTDKLDKDSSYYEFSSISHGNENLIKSGYETLKPNPYSKVKVGNDSLNPHIRLMLKNSLAQRLMDGVTQGHYASQDAFRSFFKGFYVKLTNYNPATGKGCVYYVNLNGINSRLVLYYRDDTDTKKAYNYLMNGANVSFNHSEFDPGTSDMKQVLTTPSLGQKEYYALSMYSKAFVHFPTIKNIPKDVIIQRAKLILPVSHYTGNVYTPSSNLIVYAKVTGKTGNITFSGLTNKKATYDANQKEYSFDLRDYIQYVILGKVEHEGLYFMGENYASRLERITFNGPETIYKKKPKLVVTYTRY